jgi:hypothetical protein
VDEAMVKYGVTWETLGQITYQWTFRIYEAGRTQELLRRLFR